MMLNELAPAKKSRTGRKRVGRGVGSGWGKTAGRGTKGQNSRSGGGVRPGYEGGQMPIHRRLPKRGFKNIFAKPVSIVNITDLAVFETGQVVDIAALQEKSLIPNLSSRVKLLGMGDVGGPLTIRVHACSRSARQKIEAAGGRIEDI
jgi:large subunit ribosomal protein L15